MVFSTTTLFKGIDCPKRDECRLVNCIYSHEKPVSSASVPVSTNPECTPHSADEIIEPAAKRRKITYERLSDKPPSRADLIRGQLAASRNADTNRKPQSPASKPERPSTLAKSVSPPPKADTESAAPASNASEPAVKNENPQGLGARKVHQVESLNPRLIPNDPAGHQKRSVYLKALHGEMLRLNQMMKDSKGVPFHHVLACTEQELMSLSLQSEEKIAREQPNLYANVVKQQVATFRKMNVEEWGAFVKDALFEEPPRPAKKQKQQGERVIVTGLPLEHEHLILSHLVTDQEPLAAHGYIPTPPTTIEAAEAAAAVEASANYELCDRCSARFQVYPERNEDGKLCSNGPCMYHPLRKFTPPRAKTDKETGEKQPYYPCCNEFVGSSGCTRSENHVFKTTSAARLAAINPFKVTPENPSPAKDREGKEVKAVTFDCEMGYTVYGLELIRLTAISWPQGEELLDILVRPLGALIDFNSRFSGVFPEHFKNAVPYDEWKSASTPLTTSDINDAPLPIVDSPERARELLCSFLKPTTPLLGHAIDNDLNTVRLCHPNIIDTVVLYPHPRGLPYRFGLKMLSSRHLNRAIQQGGERGHDSKEDAVATGDLVRVKVGEKWKTLWKLGWEIVDDQLVKPGSLSRSEAVTQVVEAEESARPGQENSLAGQKRKSRASEENGVSDGVVDKAVEADGSASKDKEN